MLPLSSSLSDVQLHSARPTERSHLERNHVDVPLPGSGCHYLSVLPWVVCSALLPPRRGSNTFTLICCPVNTLMYFLSLWIQCFSFESFWFICLKYRHNFSFICWCFLLQPSFLELLKPRSWSCQRGLMVDGDVLWPVFGPMPRTVADQYKFDQPFCYFHNFWSLIYFNFIALRSSLSQCNCQNSLYSNS